MSNVSLSTYSGQPANYNEAFAMAKVMADSGMFSDARGAAQAMVKIQAGAELGITPFAAMTGIHVIQGKPELGANLLASLVKGSTTHDYKVVKHTDTECEIEFYGISKRDGKWELLGTSSFTADQARKMQVKNMDKFPRNMLFARAMSNGIKWYCPDLSKAPLYSEGEIGVSSESFSRHATRPEPKTVDATYEEVPAPTADAAGNGQLFPTNTAARFEAERPAPASEPIDATPEPTAQKPWLSEEQFQKMMQAIRDGKGNLVLERMSNYRIKREYREKLNEALAMHDTTLPLE